MDRKSKVAKKHTNVLDVVVKNVRIEQPKVVVKRVS